MDKNIELIIVFGTESCRKYVDAWEKDEKISEKELSKLGNVTRRTFQTEAEAQAYKTALDDMCGWWDYAVADNNLIISDVD